MKLQTTYRELKDMFKYWTDEQLDSPIIIYDDIIDKYTQCDLITYSTGKVLDKHHPYLIINHEE